MNEVKKSFLLYLDQGEQVSMLSDVEAGKLIKALFDFARSGKRPSLENGMTQMCFSFISAQIARDAEAYREKCQRMSVNAKKGKLRTAERGEQLQAKASNCRQKQAIAVDTEYDTDDETETVTLDDTEYEMGTDREYDTETDGETNGGAITLEEAMLSAQDRVNLIRKGLPSEYVDARAERAALHGSAKGMTAFEILVDWWHDDRAKSPWNRSAIRTHREAGARSTTHLPTPAISEERDPIVNDFLRSWLEE